MNCHFPVSMRRIKVFVTSLLSFFFNKDKYGVNIIFIFIVVYNVLS